MAQSGVVRACCSAPAGRGGRESRRAGLAAASQRPGTGCL